IAFVYDVLFPYARAHLREYLQAHAGTSDVSDAVRALRAERAADSAPADDSPPEWREESHDAELESLAAYAEWLMERDRKSPGLKLLQGKVWEGGYSDGTLRGEVF